MPAMKSLACFLFGAALVAGCSQDLEGRVKKLEDNQAKYADALAFLQKVYESQKEQAKQQQAQQAQQQEQRRREEPDPNAMFAVDVTPNIKGGLVEGPATGAPVTIVEAWDFA